MRLSVSGDLWCFSVNELCDAAGVRNKKKRVLNTKLIFENLKHISFALHPSVVFDPFCCSHLARRGAVWRPTRPPDTVGFNLIGVSHVLLIDFK